MASAGLSSAKKGFVLTDALVSVFIVFVLSGLTALTVRTYLSGGQSMENAAYEIEEEAAGYFEKGASVCRICQVKETEEEEEAEEEEEDLSSLTP